MRTSPAARRLGSLRLLSVRQETFDSSVQARGEGARNEQPEIEHRRRHAHPCRAPTPGPRGVDLSGPHLDLPRARRRGLARGRGVPRARAEEGRPSRGVRAEQRRLRDRLPGRLPRRAGPRSDQLRAHRRGTGLPDQPVRCERRAGRPEAGPQPREAGHLTGVAPADRRRGFPTRSGRAPARCRTSTSTSPAPTCAS